MKYKKYDAETLEVTEIYKIPKKRLEVKKQMLEAQLKAIQEKLDVLKK